MAKFNVEVELDWLYEDDTIDEEIYRQVISGIQDRLITKVEKKMEEKLTEKINEEVEKIAETFLEKVTVNSLDTMTFPYKEDRWSSEVKYISLSEYIGKKFEVAISQKTLTENGGKPSYRDDAKYSIIDYLTNGYIANELNGKVIDMIRQAKSQAEETIISGLEANLQQQLNADMLQRLNIPGLLEKLQNTISIEGESNDS